MAAAANKPGAVHYSLVLFVVLSVVLGITTYMFDRQSKDKDAEIAKVTEESKNNNKLYQTLYDQVQTLKAKIGGTTKEASIEDPVNPQTSVVGTLSNEILASGKEVSGLNAFETLRKLREALDTASADRDSKAAKILSLEKELLALKQQYQAQVDNYKKQSSDAERVKSDAIRGFDEKLTTKTQEIASLKSQLNLTRDELAQEKESREKEVKVLNGTITGLENRIDFQKDKIDKLERLSFEEPDGAIITVNHSNQSVFIPLGDADFLKPRMTFSVYAKETPGVGRGPEDVKGKIEVISIKGPHLAEARIVEEDLYRPMVAGDLFYTPIWQPGLIEKISVIGKIDLDNDGRDDREQFHRMMATAGCIIDNEVNDDGERLPENGKITIHTRFLVKGDIPDVSEVASPEERKKVTMIQEKFEDMKKEARENGVRILKLNDFLAYIGYHNKRRSFIAGQERPFQLKAGSASESAKETGGDRTFLGNVSGVYLKKRQGRQEKFEGATSGGK